MQPIRIELVINTENGKLTTTNVAKKFESKDTKSYPVFNGFTAKQLLHKGHKIVDLQKHKTLENATVFYFEQTDEFMADLKEVTSRPKTIAEEAAEVSE